MPSSRLDEQNTRLTNNSYLSNVTCEVLMLGFALAFVSGAGIPVLARGFGMVAMYVFRECVLGSLVIVTSNNPYAFLLSQLDP